MHREYFKGYSSELNRDVEALIFGHAGTPLLVFPTSQGRFFEYEDRNMIGVLAPKIDAGEVQVFCPDSVDSESWYNKGVHPRVRVLRHLQYERYILHEMLPFLRWKNNAPRLAVIDKTPQPLQKPTDRVDLHPVSWAGHLAKAVIGAEDQA